MLLALALAALAADSTPRLAVEPAAVRLDGRSARQQVAASVLVDGAARDLTPEATFAVDPPDLARVDARGVVRPLRDGRGSLNARAGGLAASVPIEVSRYADITPVSYRRDVTAVLSKAGCNMGACHGNLNGKGGFRLSLRGEDPAFDLAMLARDAAGRRLDLASPWTSLALLKPTGQLPHEGGPRIAVDSPEADALAGWIAAGARDDLEASPKLVKLAVWPAERMAAAPSTAQQLLVTATFDDGSTRDVTRQAAYDLADPLKAQVDADGRVSVGGPTEVVVAVRYLGGRGVSRLAFLADRPGFAFREPPVRTPLDRAVFAKLRALKVQPSPASTDAVFIRRATLDALGRIPTAQEARAFLDDADASKRANLVDRLMLRPEFADFWALKWADLLRNEEKTMGEKGVWALQRWLREQVAADVPLDEFARTLLTAGGSTWRNPPSSFHRTNRDPQTAAEAVAQVFLGVRLQCARCHNHPFDAWTQDDYYGLAAFFSNIKRKKVGDYRRDDLDSHEINGDEVIYWSGKPGMVQPRSGRKLAPKPPGGPAPPLAGDGDDALVALAGWLTRDNPQFARNLANRVWFHLMGRGVVEPVDDFRDSNPPSNPALLDELTSAFVAGGFRLKPLVALVMKSEVYGLSSTPDPTNLDDEANFARAAVKLLPAEVLYDAAGQALGQADGFLKAPRRALAVQLAGARSGGDFLKAFGKPERLLTCECERSEATTLAQAFQMVNGEAIRHKLEEPGNRVGQLLGSGKSDMNILDDVYLGTLGREPTSAEREATSAYLKGRPDRRKAWEDVAWAVLNGKEFLLRH